ncbi:MAG TPA: hypothetical protein VGP68_06095 [Gemmataceae bacterium]|jgi:hypothetical protein|nr:hypothetical protein [Gemmataceae bacterium]
MRHIHSNHPQPFPASSAFDFAPLDEFGFDPAEDDFLDRHLTAIRELLNDFRNQ